MKYRRMPIEIESPEQMGYNSIECNLAESSVSDFALGDIDFAPKNMVLCYGHHTGRPDLRELIASEYKGIHADHILLTAGAAAGLFIIATSLLAAKDHLLVQHPNYATNIETPRAIGCRVDFCKLAFEKKFSIDLRQLEKLVRKETRYISVTYPHNPTGVVISEDELLGLIRIAERKKCFLLVDETYRDLTRQNGPPLAASLSDRAISISSLSKAYGMPGIRIGWIITRNKKLNELFLAAKEQLYVCNSVVDEEIAYRFLLRKEKHFKIIQEKVKQNFNILDQWMEKQALMEWIRPSGGVVCFPRIKKNVGVNIAEFYKVLNKKYKTYTGPGHWFGMSRRYMRIGYGWPGKDELKKGLDNISLALVQAQG